MPAKKDPNETVHVQVKPGEIVVYQDHVYGDRGTLQVPRRHLVDVAGKYPKASRTRCPTRGSCRRRRDDTRAEAEAAAGVVQVPAQGGRMGRARPANG